MGKGAFTLKIFMVVTILMAFAMKGLALEKTGIAEPAIKKTQVIKKDDWKAEWERTLKEARKEGVVYVYGLPVPEVRQGVIDGFQKQYPGISVNWTSLSGGQVIPKVQQEHGAGIHQVDVTIQGTTTILGGLRQFVQPVKPFLILPEVTDPKVWLGGKLDFSDDAEKINLVFALNTSSWVLYNPGIVDPREISSFWNLTDPKWKGKIIWGDPLQPGPGNLIAQFWYESPKLGKEFISRFVANEPIITRDPRVLAESVGRGKYSIGVGPNFPIALELQKVGMPIKYTPVMKEGSAATPGSATLAVMNKAPNPNAASVFVNWVLGKEGQTVFSRQGGYVSRRLDVPKDHLPADLKPEPGIVYMEVYHENYVSKREVFEKYLRTILSGS